MYIENAGNSPLHYKNTLVDFSCHDESNNPFLDFKDLN